MHSQKQILLMIVLAALVMRGPINAVGPMAPVVRDVFDLPWEAFGVLAGIPTMAFGLCSLAVLPLVAGFGSRTFAVAALTGAALGSLVRCIEWMPALFLGTLILSVSIAGLNVWVPSVIKVVFHDRQSQVMGVYTAVLSISGLLGTASVMPALEAGGVWWGPLQSGDWRLLRRLSGQWVLEAFLCPFQNGRKSVSRRAELPLHFSCGSLLFRRGSPSPLRR